MRKGCRVWGNAERLPEEGFSRIRRELPFEVVEFSKGSLNIEHEAWSVDPAMVEQAAEAIARELAPTGFGQIDLIDHNEDFILRFSIEPGAVKSRKTGIDDLLG
ncbi:hypothetical protein PCS_01313 [Desulfocurvibacter africanus PCS]|uniref:Uncharacterized protein n=1 Tax=Desulfocurvibacter africanus PCS TaxID=1262666 RepID=M5Q326_DESAF|nr:hypothetical protein [Desulfocurvibacter africanus]EMG37918.1 hypothetical protein PCS_01313 [Desulfocurvibacter africanus PCS]